MIMENEKLVRVKDHIPSIHVYLPYATENNFTNHSLYTFKDAYLRYGTVQKLKKAQEYVLANGASILILDAYRPAAAQYEMWRILPDDDFVADPTRGFSKHTRGSTVDVSLVDLEGKSIPMPSEFDDFEKAKRDYAHLSGAGLDNIKLLETAMEMAGFKAYINEWWHFNDTDIYPVLEEPPFELE